MFLCTPAAPENILSWRGKTRPHSPTTPGVFYHITLKASHCYVSRAYMEDQDIPSSLVLWNNGTAPEIESNLKCGGLDKFVSVVESQFSVFLQHLSCIRLTSDSMRDSLFTEEVLINQIMQGVA